MSVIKRFSGVMLGTALLFSGVVFGVPVSANTIEPSIPEQQFIEQVAKESNKSFEEVEQLLKEAKQDYEKVKKDLEKIDKDKKIKFKDKIDKLAKESGKSKQEAVKDLLPKLKNQNFIYNSETGDVTLDNVTTLASSSLGTVGDVLVTLSSGSGSSSGVNGHAAIVSNYSSNWTVESFMYGWSPQQPSYDVVMWHINDWKTRYSSPHGYWVTSAESGDYQAAAKYAESQMYDPYSIDFWDKYRTDEFYCSSLVWRAWYNQGEDIDGNGGGAMWPGDLISDGDTYQFY